jgi:hypothetical protein
LRGVVAVGWGAVCSVVGGYVAGAGVSDEPGLALLGSIVGGVVWVCHATRFAIASVPNRDGGGGNGARLYEWRNLRFTAMVFLSGPTGALLMYGLYWMIERPNPLDIAEDVTKFVEIGIVVGLLASVPPLVAEFASRAISRAHRRRTGLEKLQKPD